MALLRVASAIKRADCFHEEGHKSKCHSSISPYIAVYGIMEIAFSQIPGLDSMWWLSTLATVMSFTYSTIGISLGVAQIIGTSVVRRLRIRHVEKHRIYSFQKKKKTQNLLTFATNKIAANGGIKGGLTGVAVGISAAGSVTAMQKLWRSLQALGNMAFAYGFSIVLLEIQASRCPDISICLI